MGKTKRAVAETIVSYPTREEIGRALAMGVTVDRLIEAINENNELNVKLEEEEWV